MKKTLLLIVAMMISVASFAQITTSGLSGLITDQSGEPLIGATVIAVHTPSGSEYGAATNVDGRYTLQGMRSGGPYAITVSYIGYQTVEATGITLRLGESYTFSTELAEGQLLDDVVVVSTAADRFNNSKTGAANNFSSSDISSTPTVSRSVYDVINQSPLANTYSGGISFAGSNNRYNSFQIDGAISNDVFGLTSSGTNGGQTGTNIISLDALDEIQVVIAPFDVRQGGFTGGGINAVTKSGTNEFKGSAYAYYTNENLYGTTAGEIAEGESREKASEQLTRILGATAGGAIIKDKLFAFVSVEHSLSEEPVSYNAGGSDYMSLETAQSISDQYYALTGIRQTYGEHTTTQTESIDLLARIDWNINKNNKLMVRAQYKDATDDKYGNYYSSYYFDDSSYTMSNKTLSLVAELNSRISNEISNEFRVGYTRVRDFRSVGELGPTAIIYNVDFGADKTGTVYIGTERYSGANALDQDVYTITDNLSFYKGNHTFTVGTHNEIYSIGNTYIANSTGTYGYNSGYNSLEAFLSNTPSSYAYSYALDCANQDYMPILNAAQFGLYVQDEWKPNDKFTLTAGLRADLPVIFNEPVTNEDFNSSELSNNGEYYVGRMPKTQILWSPRVGFRYNVDESTLLRGGAGIFTGRVPFVWLHNAYSNSGVDKKSITAYSSDDSSLPGLSTNPSTDGVAGTETINVISEDFKYPQVFRANLGIDKSFANGWSATLEALYSKTINDIDFTNAALADNGDKTYMVEGVEASAMTHYDIISTEYSPVISLGNTSKGYSYSLSAQINKRFDMGLNLSASYTFGHSYNINNGTSSQAISNWRYNSTVNSNSPDLSFSTYDIPHQIKVTANYVSPTYGNDSFYSVVGLTYNGASGYRYSYDYSNDLNGDNYNSYTLLYIPTASEIDQMNWASEADKESFVAWVESDDYASSHRGQFAERNAILSPFEHHFNLHFAQNYIYNKAKGSRIEVSCDIMNIGNLLNREWGMYSASTYDAYPLEIKSVTESSTGVYTPEYSWNGSQVIGFDEYSSRWYMQLGVRVTF
ncbi:MAG: TonB-dependent receptor [Rikenellaceae bacterium]